MLNSLLRGYKRPRRDSLSIHRRSSSRPVRTRRDGASNDQDDSENDEEADEEDFDYDNLDDEDEENLDEQDPLLPIFSAAHLDSLPVYTITHTIRSLVVQRCETTLSWEQLRSPQISQFLVKPIQTKIRSSHFSRATLYALIANSLQFYKEGQQSPGTVGICNTRALLSELLAMRLLKDYSTRELIDALSYDFDPLSGMTQTSIAFAPTVMDKRNQAPKRLVSARTSTLEVAIRAQAKRFLAHPLVVQHLEAIWAGSIVFHSAADNLHRYPSKPAVNQDRHYGAMHTPATVQYDRGDPISHPRSKPVDSTTSGEIIRRSVSLYDPSKASLFKLSRLRVPRYRQLFSTLSYAVMLGLFLAVLSRRSLHITPLEVVFWFWSAGFMLDELVGFSEQGFSLYIASVWNAFDIGILVLFLIYYALRLYGIVLVVDDHKLRIANMAYDALASTAVLLFPRLFSVLDHYRYFSQLLIAFRLMAQDLAAVLILIAITCSGFFVAFTFSFGQDDFDGRGVAYALFQIIMGFTPAAWQVWSDFNVLGQIILALFLIICHFLVVTILITVLTNSFMAIVKNANEEHQYLFAINTISMVKSDALFSYIAPSNILGLALAPVRYVIPFRLFVSVNRTIIKVTHFPILFSIYAFEKLHLSRYAYEPVELVENRGRSMQRFGFDTFSHHSRLRMPSAATYQKDRALDEVFRRPFDGGSTIRKPALSADRRASAVDQWMTGLGQEGGASPPPEQPRSILEHLETGRPRPLRSMTSQRLAAKTRSDVRSFVSDPAERRSFTVFDRQHADEVGDLISIGIEDDGSDEASSELDLDEIETQSQRDSFQGPQGESDKENEGVDAPQANRLPTIAMPQKQNEAVSIANNGRTELSEAPREHPGGIPFFAPRKRHNRNSSNNTILFNPVASSPNSSSNSQPARRRRSSRPTTSINMSKHTTLSSPPRDMPTSRQHRQFPDRPRPAMPSRQGQFNKSVPNLSRFLDMTSSRKHRAPSFDALALDLASDIGDNRHNETAGLGVYGSSFQTQMAMATDAMRRRSEVQRERENNNGTMNRIMLSRMNTIEEGFKDILKEVKEWRNAGSAATSAGEGSGGPATAKELARRRKQRKSEKASKAREPDEERDLASAHSLLRDSLTSDDE